MDTLFKFHREGYCSEFSPKDHSFPYKILICWLGCTGGEYLYQEISDRERDWIHMRMNAIFFFLAKNSFGPGLKRILKSFFPPLVCFFFLKKKTCKMNKIIMLCYKNLTSISLLWPQFLGLHLLYSPDLHASTVFVLMYFKTFVKPLYPGFLETDLLNNVSWNTQSL